MRLRFFVAQRPGQAGEQICGVRGASWGVPVKSKAPACNHGTPRRRRGIGQETPAVPVCGLTYAAGGNDSGFELPGLKRRIAGMEHGVAVGTDRNEILPRVDNIARRLQ